MAAPVGRGNVATLLPPSAQLIFSRRLTTHTTSAMRGRLLGRLVGATPLRDHRMALTSTESLLRKMPKSGSLWDAGARLSLKRCRCVRQNRDVLTSAEEAHGPRSY